MKTLTAGDIKRIFKNIPDDQPILVIPPDDGFAYQLSDIDLTTCTDWDGSQVLVIELLSDDDCYIGFEPSDNSKIDTREFDPDFER